jgi:hypothetical protein
MDHALSDLIETPNVGATPTPVGADGHQVGDVITWRARTKDVE